MSPKLIQNGSDLPQIIPKNVCQVSGLKAGDNLDITSDGDVISLTRHGIVRSPPEEGVKTIFTIGYEGRTPEKFIIRLKNNGVLQIIDVRERPISRKKGFSKSALMQCLKEEGIGYIHMPLLGSPSYIRHEYKGGGSELLFFEKYKAYAYSIPEEIELLDYYSSDTPSALMCFEQLHVHCHRKVLAEMLADKGYKVIHI